MLKQERTADNGWSWMLLNELVPKFAARYEMYPVNTLSALQDRNLCLSTVQVTAIQSLSILNNTQWQSHQHVKSDFHSVHR